MKRIVIADNQAIFRAGAARMIAPEDDMRIVAQCENTARLLGSVQTAPQSIVLASFSLQIDLPYLVSAVKSVGSRLIVITENDDPLSSDLAHLPDGVVSRNISASDLLDCIRKVARGERYLQRSNLTAMEAPDSVGTKVKDRLTPKEMQIVALIVQGCKNKDIAIQLNTKEQVVKNYLRSIYDKTGVSDRLELALFTIHHRVLAEAAEKAGKLLQMKSA